MKVRQAEGSVPVIYTALKLLSCPALLSCLDLPLQAAGGSRYEGNDNRLNRGV